MVRKGYAGKRKRHHAWLNIIKERCKHSVKLPRVAFFNIVFNEPNHRIS